jgi:hypothetical protein
MMRFWWRVFNTHIENAFGRPWTDQKQTCGSQCLTRCQVGIFWRRCLQHETMSRYGVENTVQQWTCPLAPPPPSGGLTHLNLILLSASLF